MLHNFWTWVDKGDSNPDRRFCIRRTMRLLLVAIGIPVATGLPWVMLDRWVEHSARAKERAQQMEEEKAAAERLSQGMAESVKEGTANDATRILFGLRPGSDHKRHENDPVRESTNAEGRSDR